MSTFLLPTQHRMAMLGPKFVKAYKLATYNITTSTKKPNKIQKPKSKSVHPVMNISEATMAKISRRVAQIVSEMTVTEKQEESVYAKDPVQYCCPITREEFKDPVKSTVCGHSYNISGVIEMFRINKERPIDCPVFGCKCQVEKHNLISNPSIIGKHRVASKKQCLIIELE